MSRLYKVVEIGTGREVGHFSSKNGEGIQFEVMKLSKEEAENYIEEVGLVGKLEVVEYQLSM